MAESVRAPDPAPIASAEALVRVFNGCFAHSHDTCLVPGGQEPLYRPAGPGQPRHCIIFAHDYPASALHEVAHWCIAGCERRLLEDYGYWYSPDGRDAERQRAFEQVEVRPQALEWIFSQAACRAFRVSLDNLGGAAGDGGRFKDAVHAQALAYCREGLAPRAARFRQALAAAFGGPAVLRGEDYVRAMLDRFHPREMP